MIALVWLLLKDEYSIYCLVLLNEFPFHSTASHPRTPQKLTPKPQLIKKGKIKKPKKVLKANFEVKTNKYDPLKQTS